jgi:two-component system alkaline phosphatase synthesis response regulator PhoP
MENNHKLLLVDDEPDILEFLSFNLRRQGYNVFTAADGDAGIRLALSEIPHLVLLDMMMPVKNGIEVCKEIRTHRRLDHTIVAFLSARNEDYSLINGFEAGADDYIAKPVSIKLLIARIAALLKRSNGQASANSQKPEKISGAGIEIDTNVYTVVKNGVSISLPKKEFELLALLMSKPEQVFNREEIFFAVWGKNNSSSDRTIDVHIRKKSEKIGDEHIRTLKGVGYQFVN